MLLPSMKTAHRIMKKSFDKTEGLLLDLNGARQGLGS
jgi:hypothetical protein